MAAFLPESIRHFHKNRHMIIAYQTLTSASFNVRFCTVMDAVNAGKLRPNRSAPVVAEAAKQSTSSPYRLKNTKGAQVSNLRAPCVFPTLR